MYRYSEMSQLLREIRSGSEESGQRELMSLWEASPASHSVSQAGAGGKTTSGSCGVNLAASLEKLDQLGLLLKTYLDSSVSHLTTSLPTWSVKATDASRLYIQLRLSVPHTSENGCLLWPTATSRGLEGREGGELPERASQFSVRESCALGKLWPTPHANCHTGAGEHGEGGDNLQTTAGGQLNPDWVEILMGFPVGWTDIECTEPQEWPGWPAPMGAKLWPTPTACNPEETNATLDEDGLNILRPSGFKSASLGTLILADSRCVPKDQYPYEPPRVGTGIPNRAKRLKALGNAVVPQQAYPIFRAIMEVEAK